MNSNSINNLNSVNKLNCSSEEDKSLITLEKYRDWKQLSNEMLGTEELLSNLKIMENDLKKLTDNGVIDEDCMEYKILKGNLAQAMEIVKQPSRNVSHLAIFYQSFESNKVIANTLKNSERDD